MEPDRARRLAGARCAAGAGASVGGARDPRRRLAAVGRRSGRGYAGQPHRAGPVGSREDGKRTVGATHRLVSSGGTLTAKDQKRREAGSIFSSRATAPASPSCTSSTDPWQAPHWLLESELRSWPTDSFQQQSCCEQVLARWPNLWPNQSALGQGQWAHTKGGFPASCIKCIQARWMKKCYSGNCTCPFEHKPGRPNSWCDPTRPGMDCNPVRQ